MKNISSRIVSIASLSVRQIEQMFRLMAKYYQNMVKETFLKDLREKKEAILLVDQSGMIRGFSTIAAMACDIGGETVSAIFSGDTIIDKDYRNNTELSNCFCSYLWSNAQGDRRCYWYLISKGYKTYRHLSVFFNDFCPSFMNETSEFERELIEKLSRIRYGGRFNKETGILEAENGAVCLKCGLSERESANLDNPHIRYFFEKNPGFIQGDELACIAEVRSDNITKAFRRAIRGTWGGGDGQN